MSVHFKRNTYTCTVCHKRAANVKTGLCQRCTVIAQAEAQLSALHIAAMRDDLNEARDGR